MFLTVQEWLSPSLISVANGQTERDTTIVLCLNSSTIFDFATNITSGIHRLLAER